MQTNINTVTFNNHFGIMPVETEIRSIFDRNCAGQIDTNGDYYCIHIDHKTHTMYAIPVEIEMQIKETGRILSENEIATFHNEKVRGMTYEEERLWDEDNLLACVDLWGNIAVDEEFDIEWYMENCI